MRADVRVFSELRQGSGGEVVIVSRIEWDLNKADVARWASLTGLAASGVGAVVGGAGAGIGAVIGAVVGFVAGFTAAEIGAHAYTPPLPAPPICMQEDRVLRCRFVFPSDFGGLVSGLAVLRVSGDAAGVILAGTAAPVVLRDARPAVAVSGMLRWQRTGAIGTWDWSAVLDFNVYNRGDKPLFVGPVISYGDGAALYFNRVMVPAAPVGRDGSIRLRLVVPRAEFERARAAGTLAPPRLVIFTTAAPACWRHLHYRNLSQTSRSITSINWRHR